MAFYSKSRNKESLQEKKQTIQYKMELAHQTVFCLLFVRRIFVATSSYICRSCACVNIQQTKKKTHPVACIL